MLEKSPKSSRRVLEGEKTSLRGSVKNADWLSSSEVLRVKNVEIRGMESASGKKKSHFLEQPMRLGGWGEKKGEKKKGRGHGDLSKDWEPTYSLPSQKKTKENGIDRLSKQRFAFVRSVEEEKEARIRRGRGRSEKEYETGRKRLSTTREGD